MTEASGVQHCVLGGKKAVVSHYRLENGNILGIVAQESDIFKGNKNV